MQEINDKIITWDETLDKFLTKKMSETEEQQFIKQLEADAKMKEYVASVVLMINKLRHQGKQHDMRFQEAVRNSDTRSRKELLKLLTKKHHLQHRSLFIISIAIAASTCAVFGNSYILRSQAIEFAETSDIRYIDTTRGEGTDNITALINNVNVGNDLTDTINKLSTIFVSLTESDTVEYRTIGWYLAIAHIKNGNPEEAKSILQKVIKTCPDFKEAWELRDKLSRTFFWQ